MKKKNIHIIFAAVKVIRRVPGLSFGGIRPPGTPLFNQFKMDGNGDFQPFPKDLVHPPIVCQLKFTDSWWLKHLPPHHPQDATVIVGKDSPCENSHLIASLAGQVLAEVLRETSQGPEESNPGQGDPAFPAHLAGGIQPFLVFFFFRFPKRSSLLGEDGIF